MTLHHRKKISTCICMECELSSAVIWQQVRLIVKSERKETSTQMLVVATNHQNNPSI